MKRRVFSLALCAAMVASLFVGCGKGSAGSDNVDTSGELTWRIGGIGPITGGAAQYGQGVKNAIQLAVEGHDNTFQICFSDPNQGTVSADYIADNKLGTKIGIIYDSSDPYSSGVYQNFATEAKAKGLDIVATEAFTADNKTDFSTQLQKCKSADADLLFLPFYYTEGSIVLTQADQMGYTPTMFGVDGFDGLLGVENFDTKLAEGVYLLTPFAADSEDEATKSFVSKYEEQFKGTPNQFAADAYDGVYIIKEALEAADLKPDASNEDICDALISGIQDINYNGLTGEGMTWNDKGEVSKAPKAVIIKDGGYVSAE